MKQITAEDVRLLQKETGEGYGLAPSTLKRRYGLKEQL